MAVKIASLGVVALALISLAACVEDSHKSGMMSGGMMGNGMMRMQGGCAMMQKESAAAAPASDGKAMANMSGCAMMGNSAKAVPPQPRDQPDTKEHADHHPGS
jgi:hypothetical protein